MKNTLRSAVWVMGFYGVALVGTTLAFSTVPVSNT